MTTVLRATALLCLGAACAASRVQEGVPPAATASPAPVSAPGAAPSRSEAPASPEEASGLWRSARWGMTVEELLAALPGEARRLEPVIRLADGDVVAAGAEAQVVAGHPLTAGFVFTAGRLSIVSLRTPRERYADDRVYRDLQAHLRGRLGPPGYEVTERPFVEQRQTRWVLARGIVDLKAIPGTVVLMYSAPPAAAGAAK